MEDKAPSSSDDVRHVFFQVTLYQQLPFETSKNLIDPLSCPEAQPKPTIISEAPSRLKRAAPCSGFSSQSKSKAKSLPSLRQPTLLSPSGRPSQLLPIQASQASEPDITMGEKNQDKRRRSSRRQSILSMASTYFGPMALGSDISLDRQISPALQTSHVFFGEDAFGNSPSRSPFSLSQPRLPDDASPTSSPVLAPTLFNGPDVLKPASPIRPPVPAPSIAASPQLTPASGSPTIGGTTPATETTTAGVRLPTASRQNSKLSSISSFLPSFPEGRRASIKSFFKNARDLPSRIFRRPSKSPSPSPPPLRSTCWITEKDTMPLKNRPLNKVEKKQIKRQKAADKYVKKKNKKRLRRYRREMKRRMSKTEEAKEACKRMGKTEKLLKVMDDAKEKFWEWLDKREEKKRRERVRAYSAMREERRKSVVLVPVERTYEVVSRRASQYIESPSERLEKPTRAASVTF
ncbi:hypothetical protein TWF730_010091 [Orbilia blumenaviensis]|uniref:Uncharacterized protein n=1 Tax=Orbilia blumenaviensis TaxID=1796055 RepID=A0AAV9UUE8_9PEZI